MPMPITRFTVCAFCDRVVFISTYLLDYSIIALICVYCFCLCGLLSAEILAMVT